ADAQRQREYRDQRKSRAPAQHAQAIAKVLNQSAHPISSPDVSRHFLNQGNVPEFATSSKAGFLGRLAAFDPVLRRHAQMALNLVMEVLLALVPKTHASLSAADGFNIPAIAVISCFQRERSVASCFRPSVVSR